MARTKSKSNNQLWKKLGTTKKSTQCRSERGSGRTGRHLLGAGNGRKLY